MSYSANGSGSATLKKGCTKNQVLEALKNIDTDNFELIFFNNKDEKMIDITESESHWDEDDTLEVLNAMIPYISEGSVSYSGQEDDIWRYRFDPAEQKWITEYAVIAFDFKPFSDDELIGELKRRGYEVTRK